MDIFDEPGFTEAGRVALREYQLHGGGIALFQAYLERRKADEEVNETRRSELLTEVKNGLLHERFNANLRELMMLKILSELDPVITDLLTFCKRPGAGADQLVNVRSALRIGKGHAPSDSEGAMRRQDVQRHWISAYCKMEMNSVFRSENSIADEVSANLGVSRATAINHWRQLKDSEPGQAKWAREVADMALSENRRRAHLDSQPGITKIVTGRRRITFGKGKGV
jgi:hypothetical protein